MDTRPDPKEEGRYRLPAVEIAAARNALPITRQIQTQSVWVIIVTGSLFAAGYFFAMTKLVVLFVMVLAGYVLGRALDRLRSHGFHWRLFEKLHPNLRHEDAAQYRSNVLAFNARTIILQAVIAGVVAAGAVIWTARIGGRWWVVLICILVHAYGLTLFKVLPKASADFIKLGEAATASGCRIGLFRPFHDEYSPFARNVFIPILMGYGEVEFVTDSSFEKVSPAGVFGRGYEKEDLNSVGKRFDNDEWKEHVGEIIRNIDIAVCDVTVTSRGVIWEVAHCYEHLPAHRVILLLNAAALDKHTLEKHIRTLYSKLGKYEGMPRDVEPYVFVFSPDVGSAEVIANDIHRKMVQIVQREMSDE